MFWYPHSRAFSNPSAAASTGRTLLSPFPAPAYAPAMNMAMAVTMRPRSATPS
ncbi:hypothetical protein PVA48_11100 [Akkermansia sp. JRP_AM1]|uniref:hypothetical protein n=1 Tax=Akkermansia sp. JRP_AM1 TaxID=3414159 RepID=UPI003BFA7A11